MPDGNRFLIAPSLKKTAKNNYFSRNNYHRYNIMYIVNNNVYYNISKERRGKKNEESDWN